MTSTTIPPDQLPAAVRPDLAAAHGARDTEAALHRFALADGLRTELIIAP